MTRKAYMTYIHAHGASMYRLMKATEQAPYVYARGASILHLSLNTYFLEKCKIYRHKLGGQPILMIKA